MVLRVLICQTLMLFYLSTFIYAHKSTRYQNTKDYVRYPSRSRCAISGVMVISREFLRPLLKAEQITLEVLGHVQLFAINLTQVCN